MAGNDDENFDFLYKVVVTGDSGVGKTNIITRFTTGEFNLENKATIGVEFGHAEVTLSDGTQVKVQIWDTAGQERFRAITRGYYRGAVGALMVFDVTKAASFKNAEKWLQELREHADTDIIIMMVGNKTDLKNQREVATDEAKKFSQKNNLLYIETSALDGSNIKEAFQQTITAIYEKRGKGNEGGQEAEPAKQNPNKKETQVIKISKPAENQPDPVKPKGGCC